MLILGVDTSGKNGSIALVQIEHGNSRTLEIVPLEGGTFSAQLVPQISDLLARHRLTKRDIDAFAVASGPGSFTGLRVGLAAIKGLAEVLQKPIAAVSLLEAVVRSSGAEGELIAALDASRGEVYVADIQVSGSRTTVRDQRLVAVADFASMNSDREIVTPDEKIADLARQNHLQVKSVERPRADVIARLGFDRIQAGDVISPETLDANYIRRSDAEVKKFTTAKNNNINAQK
jgi:tRNA threonylcarbamoyladenosine biosynthesis protein TsaB